MSKSFVYRRCPNCGQRALFFSLSIYRCRICQKYCCDRCAGQDGPTLICPHCKRRACVSQVGYTG